ncbi:MAG TPA: RnfABCDGE type electron transport complex subunit G [Gammaproteobacteria bacterium]
MEPEAKQSGARTLPMLLLAVVLGAAAVSAMQYLTAERIASNREAHTLAVVREALPVDHDNDLLHDRIEVVDPVRLGSRDPVMVFRARRGAAPAGVVLMPVVAQGYNGRIELAIGIAADGVLAGVRVARHRETEGLGDRVHQSRSPWIAQFEGRSLDNTPESDWAVRSDGGAFDQVSGATITPRGVINAVRSALEYHLIHREELYR